MPLGKVIVAMLSGQHSVWHTELHLPPKAASAKWKVGNSLVADVAAMLNVQF